MKKKAFSDTRNETGEGMIHMAALATPKGSSYVLKSGSAKKVVESKTTPAKALKIKDRAEAFERNNLAKK